MKKIVHYFLLIICVSLIAQHNTHAKVSPGYTYNRNFQKLELLTWGINVTSITSNAIVLSKGKRNYIVSGIGIASGAGAIAMAFHNDATMDEIDLAFGAASLVMGIYALVFTEKKQRPEKATLLKNVDFGLSFASTSVNKPVFRVSYKF